MIKDSKFQNEFMKSSFLPKYEPNIVRSFPQYCATLHGRNPYNFWFIFEFFENRCFHEFILKFTDLYQVLSIMIRLDKIESIIVKIMSEKANFVLKNDLKFELTTTKLFFWTAWTKDRGQKKAIFHAIIMPSCFPP